MKLKEFGPRGARPKFYYVDPPLKCIHSGISGNIKQPFQIVINLKIYFCQI